MTILGIETSCDETALAIIETKESNAPFSFRVVDSLVHSQAELHSAYGGVYPSLAKREHAKNLVPLLAKLLDGMPSSKDLSDEEFASAIDEFRKEILPQNPDLFTAVEHADFLKKVPPIDAIAVTEGPGLEPALWVGINFARMLGRIWGVPIMPINHMEGHVVGSLVESDVANGAWQELKAAPLPAIALLISGGHTQLVNVPSDFWDKTPRYTILGQTKDDAVGEAFDKVARLLGLPYPGGPHISKLAAEASELGIQSPVKLPRPMLGSGDLDFSFSGLKTAVLYAVQKAQKEEKFTDDFKKGLAYEFEQAVAEVLEKKTRVAIEETGAKSLIVGGGVAANAEIRKRCEKLAKENNIPLFLPSRHISGDNALMIALAGAIGMNVSDEKLSTKRELRASGTKSL